MDKRTKRISVKLDDFLLWHNNPRLLEDFGEERDIEAIESAQDELLSRMQSEGQVKELIKSILSNGWLGYDTILVAEYNSKYVVLEGNRRITALKVIVENARKGYRKVQGYSGATDISNFENQIIDGIDCFNVGDFKNLPEDIEDLVNKILNIRHVIGQKEWPLHRKSFKVFKDYMNMLLVHDPSILNTEPKSFYISDNVVKRLASFMGEKTNAVKEYCYIYRLRYQIEEKLSDLGSSFPQDKTSYLPEFLGKPDLRARFGFDMDSGTLSSEEQLEKFVKIFFSYPGNVPIVKSAAAGDYSLRHYAYVVKKDPTPEEAYIKQIEDDNECPREVAGELATINKQYELENALDKISNILGRLDLSKIRKSHFDNDQVRLLINNILEDFNGLQDKYNRWEEDNNE